VRWLAFAVALPPVLAASALLEWAARRDAALVPWRWCRRHRFRFLYARACPHCLAEGK